MLWMFPIPRPHVAVRKFRHSSPTNLHHLIVIATTLLLLSDLPSTSIRNTYIRPCFRCSLAHHQFHWLHTTPAPDLKLYLVSNCLRFFRSAHSPSPITHLPSGFLSTYYPPPLPFASASGPEPPFPSSSLSTLSSFNLPF